MYTLLHISLNCLGIDQKHGNRAGPSCDAANSNVKIQQPWTWAFMRYMRYICYDVLYSVYSSFNVSKLLTLTKTFRTWNFIEDWVAQECAAPFDSNIYRQIKQKEINVCFSQALWPRWSMWEWLDGIGQKVSHSNSAQIKKDTIPTKLFAYTFKFFQESVFLFYLTTSCIKQIRTKYTYRLPSG